MKIKITKFKRLENRTIEVPAEISGGNGTGKTSILEAISFVLTGKNLNGSTFEQVYDNRDDLHNAIADVTYIDAYGNEFRRLVKPEFQTTRSGEEKVKILRSTRCTKNRIDTNDFSDEFEDFYKYGTDYFFNQKEDEQRSMFIDLMKSLLPDCDVKNEQRKLKTLKKAQRETQTELKGLRSEIKSIKDVEVVEIPDTLEKLEADYQKLINSSSDNQSLISDINKRNNQLLSDFRNKQNQLETDIAKNNRSIKNGKAEIWSLEEDLHNAQSTEFGGFEITPTDEIKSKVDNLNSQLSELTYFDDLKEYAKLNAKSNPIVSENMERMKKLRYATPDNLPEGEKITDVCFNCGQSSDKVLAKGVENIIEKLKAENRQILQREMCDVNNKYIQIKDERDRYQANLNHIEAENKANKEKEAKLKRSFDINKTNNIDKIKADIKKTKLQVDEAESKIKDLQAELNSLEEPTLEELPTELTISDELKNAHSEYQNLRDEIIGQKAVNKNNAEKIDEKSKEVDKKVSLLMEIDEKIITLQNEITDYFSNLTDVVKREFKGKIDIGVELQEYVMARDDYKDVFKITADDKVFPYELNGALINNVKLQVLATLQRLKGYEGITILDNAEANTTQPIEPCGLNLVVSMATHDKELIIK